MQWRARCSSARECRERGNGSMLVELNAPFPCLLCHAFQLQRVLGLGLGLGLGLPLVLAACLATFFYLRRRS